MKILIIGAVFALALAGAASAAPVTGSYHSGPGTAIQNHPNPGNLSVVIQTSHSDYAKTVQTPNGGNVAIIIQSGKGQTATIKQ